MKILKKIMIYKTFKMKNYRKDINNYLIFLKYNQKQDFHLKVKKIKLYVSLQTVKIEYQKIKYKFQKMKNNL